MRSEWLLTFRRNPYPAHEGKAPLKRRPRQSVFSTYIPPFLSIRLG
ncbi:MAG: hypothetical protein E7046_01185 [Lentisphaerae bacterium]|nr:hypothetical protein [Lentisphaerota bacterium]